MRRHQRLFLLAAPALLTACGSVPTRTFQFDAVSDAGTPLPALVVVGDDWVGAAQNRQFVNIAHKDDTLPLKVAFDRAEVQVTVAAIEVNPDTGEPERIPRSRMDRSDYKAEPRQLQLRDPLKQLFILPHK